ncbi:hypothetical protein JVT61DRAFT_8358 [Boletus reticuloceps]|uniref:Ubiquitin-like protease family profile domain-containing protein n=1 Tax=Boletus reticuloceps TaxID=495285 RepID=A0A8I3ACF1_9AGAM|nr:hypothetical protein JVT61DRAFT_8358 [Boletus reticuloceps]
MLLRYAATPTSLIAVPIHSVTCAHLAIDFATSYHLPLWIISYWFKVSHLHNTIWPPWVNAEQVLKQLSCLWRKASNPKGSQDLLQQAYMLLGSLPWSGFVLGFETHEKINHLAAYMTQEWLSDVHEMQMLELLQVTIRRQMATIEIEIKGPYFYGYLKSASEAGESRYKDSASFSPARGFGEALHSGQCTSISFITNVNGNHWVATVMDFAEHLHPILQLTRAFAELPIPFQQDSFSCGILAFGALAHFYLPDQYPLMDPRLVDDERIKVFLEIGRHHLKHATTCSPESQHDFSYLTAHFRHHKNTVDGQPHPMSDQRIKRTPSTPLPKSNRPSKKFEVEPAGIHMALKKQSESKSVGLMKWLTKCTPAEYQAQSEKVNAMAEEALKEYEVMVYMQTKHRKKEVQENNKLCQQRCCQAVYAAEIARGVQFPGGTKQKTKVSVVLWYQTFYLWLMSGISCSPSR